MFRHVALFTFSADSTPEQRQALADTLARLPGLIPELRDFRFGPDAGLNPGANLDFAVVADFDSVEDYRVYAGHPDHVEIITQRLQPILAERAAVQYEAG